MPKSTRHVPPPVLVGTDFSEQATQAAIVAGRLALAKHQPVLLLHASLPSRRGLPTREHGNDVSLALRRDAARLRQLGASVSTERGVGHADEVLTKRARETKAALLVIGALGVRAPTRRFLGSIAERTAEWTPAPTLVVRQARPFEEWLAGRRPLRVFVGFDFTVTAEAALDWVRTLEAAGPCEITLGHLNVPATDERRFGVLDRLPAGDNAPRVQDLLEQQVRDRARSILGDRDVRVAIQPGHGRIDLDLVAMALDAHADLIVVGTHQRHGLARLWSGSVSRGVLSEAPSSVAVVPVAPSDTRWPKMPSMQRVLVATDPSAQAKRIIAYACGITRPGGHVRLLTVVHPRAIGGGAYETTLGQSRRHARHVQAVARRLETLRPPDAQAHGIDTQASVVEVQDPVSGICQEAERFDADVIVVGTKGAGLTAAVIGSVAQGVLAKSARPVLVVNPPKQ